jgi:hypothetical protein
MPVNTKRKRIVAPAVPRGRGAKFQADLAPAEDRTVPRVRIEWTPRQLVRLAELASADVAHPPTGKLIRAMRDRGVR